jgi:hypothetical protein
VIKKKKHFRNKDSLFKQFVLVRFFKRQISRWNEISKQPNFANLKRQNVDKKVYKIFGVERWKHRNSVGGNDQISYSHPML